MYSIFVSIIVFLMYLLVYRSCKQKVALVISIASLVCGISISLFIPINGFIPKTEPTETVDLVKTKTKLASVKNQDVYVIRGKNNNKYGFTYNGSEDFDVYEVINSKDVMIIESDSCKRPQLYIYNSEAKKTKWSLGIFCMSMSKYVFYVPRGTVQYVKEV